MQIPGYKILRKIDQGGMSTVYLAIQMSVGREVALKVMSPALNADPIFSERFQREANIVGQLSHPNIVSIYDIGRYKSLNYIAMDFLPGGSVSDKIRQGIPSSEILSIIKHVANALDLAHWKGYIHRDIKPENILFRDDNSPVITDFGVAKMVNANSGVTHAGTVVGTPHYMSPEQARGKSIDGRSDIYSLGIVFYEMLTGTVPFKAEEAVAIAIKHLTAPIPKLPPQYAIYQKLLDKLLAKDADQRYQRGSELVAAIEALESGLSIGHSNFGTTDPSSMTVNTLLRALCITTYAALRASLCNFTHWLFSWRYTPKKGIYRRPIAQVFEVKSQDNTEIHERSTIVSTHVQRAAHYQKVGSQKLRTLTSSLTLFFILGSIWAAFSSAIYNFDLPFEESLPGKVRSIALFSAEFLQNPKQALQNNYLQTSRPDSSAQETHKLVKKPSDTQIVHSGNQSTPKEYLINKPIIKQNELSRAQETSIEIPPPPMYALEVLAKPNTARVRILNIKERYFSGIKLLPGRYHIEVNAKGYDQEKRWIHLNQDHQEAFNLRKTPVPGAKFANQLKNGDQGPEMVIIPAGSFLMGSELEENTQPLRRVTITHPFAISQYEITFSDYIKYAKDQNKAIPDDSGWGKENRPVINISWADATDYTRWLRKQTGSLYRLPTEAEWEYAARSNIKGNYWWPAVKSAPANCRRGCNSDYSGFFISKTAPVGSYQGNAFGLFDSSGNVAEWTADCYRNNFLNAPKDGSAVTDESCTERVIRGGSMRDSVGKISNHMRNYQIDTEKRNNLGFRVVVDLYRKNSEM